MNGTVKQSGFSLVEAMVGGALIAGLGLMGASIFSQQSSKVNYVDAQEKLNSYHNNLRRMFSEENHCNALLASSVPVSSLAPVSINTCCPAGSVSCEITGISSCLANVDEPIKVPPTNKKEVLSVDKTKASNFTDNTRRIRLDSIKYYDPFKQEYVATMSANANKNFEMHLTYELLNVKGGPPFIRKIIPLSLRFAESGVFRGCSTNRIGSNETARKELCESLNGLNPDYAMVAWVVDANGVGKCEALNTQNKIKCDGGLVLYGISSTGHPICRSILNTADQGKMINNVPGACQTGTSIRFEKVNGRIVVVCE